jgi:hypothetical protein
MSQVNNFTVQDGTGLAVRQAFNAALQALATSNSGTTAPNAPQQGELWLNTAASPRELSFWDDTLGAWVQITGSPTEVLELGLPAGPSNNVALGAKYGFLDVTLAGDGSITGIAAGFDGQELIVTNVSAHNLTLVPLSGLSVATNRIRLVAPGTTLPQYDSLYMRYSTTLGLWVGVS